MALIWPYNNVLPEHDESLLLRCDKNVMLPVNPTAGLKFLKVSEAPDLQSIVMIQLELQTHLPHCTFFTTPTADAS